MPRTPTTPPSRSSPLLPAPFGIERELPHEPHGHDHRLVLGGILWVVRNGASWRDMPRRYGKWERAYRRYRLWSDTGLWERILNTLRNATDEDPADVLL